MKSTFNLIYKTKHQFKNKEAIYQTKFYFAKKSQKPPKENTPGIHEYYEETEERGPIAYTEARKQPLDALEEKEFQSGQQIENIKDIKDFENNQNKKSNRVIMVQGASRGIGNEFVRQLLKRDGYRVIATSRQRPDTVEGFKQFKEEHPYQFCGVNLDLDEPQSFDRAFGHINRIFTHIDVLINVTGILHTSDGIIPEKSYKHMNGHFMRQVFQINTIGAALVMKKFAPLLIAAENNSNATFSRPSVIACLSARVGSIGDNKLGGWYSYRASKAALNQIIKCFSIEFARNRDKVACISLHPGTVDTDLTKPYKKNVKPEMLFTRERAVKQLLKIIDGVTMEDNGKFYGWDGKTIPW